MTGALQRATLRRCQVPAWAALVVGLLAGATSLRAGDFAVLKPDALTHHVSRFNSSDPERITNSVSNAQSANWLQAHIPLFECPDREVEDIYYFRWWSFRKHLVQTTNGFLLTEFLTPVKHAGAFNTISCAVGHHLAEGRWLRDDRYLNDYTRFWLRGANGKPQPHFHKYSSWFAAAVWDRYLVNGDRAFVTNLLVELVADYRAWETERRLTNGLFWQFDVRDGMEESISGSRTNQNLRPTINSYMFANARAIAEIARLANQPTLAAEFSAKSTELQRLVQAHLWDPDAQFFKTLVPSVSSVPSVPSTAREAIGYIPWQFSLPEPGHGYELAWSQFADPRGFSAPAGLTTAERRHAQFRTHGVGTCEWDGAVWPFATSQTLTALANALRSDSRITNHVSPADYFSAFLTYTQSQHADGKPYIGEYLDEVTGAWINGKNDRSRYYNHSTFADLLITGVIGLRPRADDTVELWPLLPANSWDWFALDGIHYHGHTLAILWDKDGTRYQRGPGLHLLCDGKLIAQAPTLTRITGRLP